MPPISVLIKPASGNCNLRCRYCFYSSITTMRETESFGFMSPETLEIIVRKALGAADGLCVFAFQGGEPTLIGLDFFKALMEFERKYNVNNVEIQNTIQTNGILINDEWAEFLAGNKFLTGLSLDGPKNIHDGMRIDPNGKGSFARTADAMRLLKKHRAEFNILTTVHAGVARHPEQVYHFFKKNECKYLQFIACLDPLGKEPGGMDYSLTPQRYGAFLKTLFKLWYDDALRGTPVSIRYFENLLGMVVGHPPEACGMTGQCACQFVIEADGGVYPCDFYVLDEWYLGNIRDMEFSKLRACETARRFVEISRYRSPECQNCQWLSLCRGGCRRYRLPQPDGTPGLYYYCNAISDFFAYAIPLLNNLAKGIHLYERI